MTSTTTIEISTVLRDIAIASLCLAFNVALGVCASRQTIGGAPPQTRATAPPRQFQRFTSLPVEIREIIYEHAMRSGGHFAAPTSAFSRAAQTSYILHNQVPAIGFTNTVERLIAVSVFIRNFHFVLTRDTDAGRMTAWLEQFGDRYGFSSVKHMQLNYVPSNRHQSLLHRIQLVQRLPGLRNLIISVPLDEISIFGYVTRMRLQLGDLAQCGQLRKIVFIISDRDGFQYVANSLRATTLKGIVQAIATEFQAVHGMALAVNLDVSDRNGRFLGRML